MKVLQELQIDASQVFLDYSKKLGEGNWTKVYAGQYKGKMVALKIASKDEKEIKRELSILSRLSHDNIVKLHGACRKDGKLLGVLEICAKGCLENIIQGEQAMLTVSRRHSMAMDIALGLSFLHESRVFHSDLKVANILVTEDYKCKIADFNLSKRIPEGKDTFYARGGTTLYSSPEVMQGKSASFASDIYSLGLCLFELLTLQRYSDLVEQMGGRELLRLLRKGTMQVELTGWPEDFKMLQQTVTDCCATSSTCRPSAAEVLVCLQSIVDNREYAPAAPPLAQCRTESPAPEQRLEDDQQSASATLQPAHSAAQRPTRAQLQLGGFAVITECRHPGHGCLVSLQQHHPGSGRWLVRCGHRIVWVAENSLQAVKIHPAFRPCSHAPRPQAFLFPRHFPGRRTIPASLVPAAPRVEEVRESETFEDEMPTIVEEQSDEEQEGSHHSDSASELSQEFPRYPLNNATEGPDDWSSDDERHDQNLALKSYSHHLTTQGFHHRTSTHAFFAS